MQHGIFGLEEVFLIHILCNNIMMFAHKILTVHNVFLHKQEWEILLIKLIHTIYMEPAGGQNKKIVLKNLIIQIINIHTHLG